MSDENDFKDEHKDSHEEGGEEEVRLAAASIRDDAVN
jgi:hypothetical protein